MEVTNSDIVGILHTYGAGRVEQHEPPGEPLWADARAAHLGAQLANDADLASGKRVRATTEVAEVGSVISVLSSSLKIVRFTGWVGTTSCLLRLGHLQSRQPQRKWNQKLEVANRITS